jgi:hypothetical protein
VAKRRVPKHKTPTQDIPVKVLDDALDAHSRAFHNVLRNPKQTVILDASRAGLLAAIKVIDLYRLAQSWGRVGVAAEEVT